MDIYEKSKPLKHTPISAYACIILSLLLLLIIVPG